MENIILEYEQSSENFDIINKIVNAPKSTTPASQVSNTGTAGNAFKRQVLRLLNTINLKFHQLSDDINSLRIEIQTNHPLIEKNLEEQLLKKLPIPISSSEGLNEVEKFRGNENNFEQLIKELVRLGGTCQKQNSKIQIKQFLSLFNN